MAVRMGLEKPHAEIDQDNQGMHREKTEIAASDKVEEGATNDIMTFTNGQCVLNHSGNATRQTCEQS